MRLAQQAGADIVGDENILEKVILHSTSTAAVYSIVCRSRAKSLLVTNLICACVPHQCILLCRSTIKY